MKEKREIVKILIAGEGGQGIQTIAKILADAARVNWYEVSLIPHYGVEMRMGISFAYLQIAKGHQIGYPKFSHADILVVLAKRDLAIPKKFIDTNSTIVNCLDLISELQKYQLPNKTFNLMCMGIILKELSNYGYELGISKVKEVIAKHLGHKTDLGSNLAAYEIGLKLDKKLYSQSLDKVKPDKFSPLIDSDDKKQVVRFPNLCKGCGLCLVKCPAKAISWSIDEINFISRPMPKVDLDKCIACQTCQNICPDCAIKVTKR